MRLLLTAVAIAGGAQEQRFTFAIARPDGALVPFAAYDAGRWERAWPEADEASDATTVDSVPSVWRGRGGRVPAVWRVWPASGAAPIEAKVTGVDVVDAHCSTQVALTTDLPTVKAEHPLKFGIAVDSPTVPVSAIERVPPSDPAWAAAERAVLASFPELEAAQATKDRAQLPREKPAIQITALHREANAARSPLYFVARKQYRTPHSPRDPQCSVLTILTGWLVPTDGATYTLVDPRVFIADCDLKGTRTGLPLAAFRVSERLFWVMQEHGYEDETYLIAEIRGTEVRYRIEVNGGGC